MIALTALSGLSGLFESSPGEYAPPGESYFDNSYFFASYFPDSHWA